MLVIGIDDAGRGPLIGPMILAGVLMEEDVEALLKAKGVRDSKTLTHPARVRLAEIIKSHSLGSYAVKAFPNEIDHAIHSGINLNTLEAMKAGEIINNLNTEKETIKVIIDCPSVNIKAWTEKVIEFIKHPSNLAIVCEHKADVNHPSVSAASILAKVVREEEVAKLKKQYGEIGSGYPSDPFTKEFVKTHGKKHKDSGIFRKSWATWKSFFPEGKQSTLKKF
ncbi:ribonuclease HII [Candidatus Pacearchaeota archaeon]|nr:ribonuclease HII [Candidatus Pacearchaeota archaeon]